MTAKAVSTSDKTLSALFGLSVVLLVFAMGTVATNHYLIRENNERITALEILEKRVADLDLRIASRLDERIREVEMKTHTHDE